MGGSSSRKIQFVDPGIGFYDSAVDGQIAAGEIKEIFHAPEVGRHTLYIYNPNAFDLYLRADKTDTGRSLTIPALEFRSFEVHMLGEKRVSEDEIEYYGHCEWSGPVFIQNPSGGAADLEAYEVY